ncbi:unnamed protein product [Macrosiphum euphorbiae]|uniref:Uncharacterized protein n=1 Tax=Macrosiphum euphorbiae TaxID=13131 RepID=A0AAV0XWS0_9HEMI|nr:unnamed protein product [Macrosiphum euphorbiae]
MVIFWLFWEMVMSDIGSEVDELEDDNCFPIDEFDQLLNDFDDLSSDILPDIEEVEPDFINTNKRDIHWVQKPFEPPTKIYDYMFKIV